MKTWCATCGGYWNRDREEPACPTCGRYALREPEPPRKPDGYRNDHKKDFHDHLCRCGHRNGDHQAEYPDPCTFSDCECWALDCATCLDAEAAEDEAETEGIRAWLMSGGTAR